MPCGGGVLCLEASCGALEGLVGVIGGLLSTLPTSAAVVLAFVVTTSPTGGDETLDFFRLRGLALGTGELSPSLSSKGLVAACFVELAFLGGCAGLFGLSEVSSPGPDETFSFFESRLTILLSEPISLLPRGLMLSPVSSGSSRRSPLATGGGGLVGASVLGIVEEIALVGLGGGGLLGGLTFESGRLFAGFSSSVVPSFLLFLRGALEGRAVSGNRLLILLGGGGRATLGGPAPPGFPSRPAGEVGV